MSKEIRKSAGTVKFNLNNPEERKLYEDWKAYVEKNSINTAGFFKKAMRDIINKNAQQSV
ncbi:hypothetical protein [Diaphorobacter aerolatus]|uniref:Uncharacterized protein n=1 Tax=Diaphorobacter aerolatus TaxID=1288495 RepID=A0A7H0GJE0_9BURK|nr:hypothetical protein [Diaphorobacter aerolatus]QNP48406.1 hypothetical protein H9K75_21025 [Diaphorobacter aerolatus]